MAGLKPSADADNAAQIKDALAPTQATGSTLLRIHNVSEQARLLRAALQDDKQRIGFFMGAGCPLGVYDESGKESINLIPAVVPLTNRIAKELQDTDNKAGSKTTLKTHWDCMISECGDAEGASPTVEDVLTELRTLIHRRGGGDVSGMKKSDLGPLDQEICKCIMNAVSESLPEHRCAYDRFASWVGGVQRTSPVEVFTPNYDLLFEQAFERQPLPHFDGFVGSREPFFDLASIEHDQVPSRWTRLWKLHGSINWERLDRTVKGKKETRVVRVSGNAEASKVMIYPSHLKYDQSRRMPYLAMLDRLRAFFRSDGSRNGSGPPLLVVCGYSFLDHHLNEVLLDGLRGNRRAHCFALMYGRLEEIKPAIEYAERTHNLSLLARDGAVVGTRKGYYVNKVVENIDQEPWLQSKEEAGADGYKERVIIGSNLGDFHHFGLFLERISGRTIDGEQGTHGH